jgi:hypothetical protein
MLCAPRVHKGVCYDQPLQVNRKVIRPAYGEVMVYEHEFVNPFSSEQVSGAIIVSCFLHYAYSPSIDQAEGTGQHLPWQQAVATPSVQQRKEYSSTQYKLMG